MKLNGWNGCGRAAAPLNKFKLRCSGLWVFSSLSLHFISFNFISTCLSAQSINFISSSLQVQWNQGLWNGMKSASWNGIKPRRGAELITSPFSNKEGSKTTILLIQSNNSPIHSIKFHLIELVSCLWLARLLSLMKIADCCPMAGGREEERLKSSSIHQLFHSFILQQIDSFRMGHSAGQRKQVFFSLPLVSFLGWSAPFN